VGQEEVTAIDNRYIPFSQVVWRKWSRGIKKKLKGDAGIDWGVLWWEAFSAYKLWKTRSRKGKIGIERSGEDVWVGIIQGKKKEMESWHRGQVQSTKGIEAPFSLKYRVKYFSPFIQNGEEYRRLEEYGWEHRDFRPEIASTFLNVVRDDAISWQWQGEIRVKCSVIHATENGKGFATSMLSTLSLVRASRGWWLSNLHMIALLI
jgi:hypothetical protein